MKVTIYRPTKTATQSGHGGTRRWVLEPDAEAAPGNDRLTGWSGSSDTLRQVRLRFDSREAAVAYARANGMDYEVVEPRERRPMMRSYADNFRYDRVS